jgi:diguanylate cyclase (GGDEF)-like protein
MTADRNPLTPLVLLVDDQEWTSRSIESILRPKGHVVLKAYTGRQAIDLVQKTSPDLVIVDYHLPDFDGIEVARRLRATPNIHSVTPLLMMSSSTLGRAARLEALGAGVWDILRHPVDPSELVLRVETFVAAKQEADRVRDESLMDPKTGFYNTRGLLRRAGELSADAVRFDRPIACIALGPESIAIHHGAEGEQGELGSPIVAKALRSVTRLCDTVGRLGPGEFVIVAPGTDREGAVRLADRVLEALDEASGSVGPSDPVAEDLKLRAGFYALQGEQEDPVVPEDLLTKATMALRRAQADEGGFRVRSYEA